MKRTVTITFEIDAAKYYKAEDSPLGTIELVDEMLSGDADFPDGPITITCDGETQVLPLAVSREIRT